MQNKAALTYKGYAIEPLIYPYIEPKRSNKLRVRRYRAGVRIINIDTNAEQTARLAPDFEFFGDARRAAETHGRKMIDNPEEALEDQEGADPVAIAAPAETVAAVAAAPTAETAVDAPAAVPAAAVPPAAAPAAARSTKAATAKAAAAAADADAKPGDAEAEAAPAAADPAP